MFTINETVLQHCNIRPNTSATTRDASQCRNFSVLLYLPDRPGLALCGFNQFPKLRKHLKSQHFSPDDKVKSAVRTR